MVVCVCSSQPRFRPIPIPIPFHCISFILSPPLTLESIGQTTPISKATSRVVISITEMSLDVSGYWHRAALTPMGLLVYLKDEVHLYSATNKANIDIEMGETVKATQEHAGGEIIVTTHRLVWLKTMTGPSSAATPTHSRLALYLPLESVSKLEIRTGSMLAFGLFSTPRLLVYLHDPPTMEYLRLLHARTISPALAASSPMPTKPIPSTLTRICRLACRGEIQPSQIMQPIQQALQAGVWRVAEPPNTNNTNIGGPSNSSSPSIGSGPSVSSSSFRTTGAGIGGIVRDAKTRERAVDVAIETAFSDLSTLMANAKSIVDLAARLRASNSRELESGEARASFDQAMEHMGILNPVTQSMTGSAFHEQLAREMADYLPTLVAKEGGMMLLTDAYCRINRARGTQLISPHDCLTAAGLLQKLNAPLRLQELSSGVKVIVADGAVEEVTGRLRRELEESSSSLAVSMGGGYDSLRDAPTLSPLQVSERWHISIILAKQYLCIAEQQAILCRDESVHGLTFMLNQF